jgi:RNA polymerase sigma-70 factor (ECF subfamily)
MISYLSFSHRSDEEIIRKLTEGGSNKRKGEEELFSRFSYFIKLAMDRYHLREEDAFDAYSDTIISAIETLSNGQFGHRSSLKTYLFQIFHNKCVDILRKSTTNKSSVNHTTEIGHVLLHMSDTAKSIVQKLIEQSDLTEMKKKLSELGENCRNLLMMFAEGYSDKEICLSLEYKTADVVKTSRLRCLERLRNMYMQPGKK